MAQTSDLLLWLLWWCLFFTDCVRRPQPPPASHLAKAWPLHCAQVAKTTTICWCLKRLDQVDQVGKIPHRIQPAFVNRAGMYHLSTCYSVRLLEYYVVIPMIFSTRWVYLYTRSLGVCSKFVKGCQKALCSVSFWYSLCLYVLCMCVSLRKTTSNVTWEKYIRENPKIMLQHVAKYCNMF